MDPDPSGPKTYGTYTGYNCTIGTVTNLLFLSGNKDEMKAEREEQGSPHCCSIVSLSLTTEAGCWPDAVSNILMS
jgi:hypothetical protein